MFSEAYTYLLRSLRLARAQEPNFYTIRDNLNSALNAVLSDATQPETLKRDAANRIQQAISYTYSRTNPAMPFAPMNFQSMASTPISPFQRNTMGPYGFVKGPIVTSSRSLEFAIQVSTINEGAPFVSESMDSIGVICSISCR